MKFVLFKDLTDLFVSGVRAVVLIKFGVKSGNLSSTLCILIMPSRPKNKKQQTYPPYTLDISYASSSAQYGKKVQNWPLPGMASKLCRFLLCGGLLHVTVRIDMATKPPKAATSCNLRGVTKIAALLHVAL